MQQLDVLPSRFFYTLGREKASLMADIAWLVTPSEQGRGIAVETASTVVTWLHSIDVRHIRAFIHPDRAASAREARRTGLAPMTVLVDDEIVWEVVMPPVAER